MEREGVREVGSEGGKEGKNFEGREGGRQARRKGVREILVKSILYTLTGKQPTHTHTHTHKLSHTRMHIIGYLTCFEGTHHLHTVREGGKEGGREVGR